MPVIPLHAARPLERRDDNSSSDNANPSNENPTGPNAGLIVGAIIGTILVLLVAVVVVPALLKRRRHLQEQHSAGPPAPLNPAMRQLTRVSRADRSFFGHRKVPKHLVLQSPRRVSFAIPDIPQRQQHQAPPAATPKSAIPGTPRSLHPVTPRSALAPPVTPRSALLSPKPGGTPIPRSPLAAHSPIRSGYTPNYPPYSAAIQPGQDGNPFSSPLDEKAEPSALSTSGEASPLTAYINHLNSVSKVPPKTAPAYTTSHTIGKTAQSLQRRGTATSAPGSGRSLSSESDYSTSPDTDRLGPHGFGNAPHSMPARGHESFATDQDKRLGGAGQRLQAKFASPQVVKFSDRPSPESPESDYGPASDNSPVIPLSPGDAIILSPNPPRSAFPFKSPGAYTPLDRPHF